MAAVRTPLLVRELQAAGHDVRVAATGPSLAFFAPEELNGPLLYRDEDDWPAEGLFTVGDPVLHIELRKWAELMVIAPLDANTLAKLALGICDNLLTCVYRAWDRERPLLLAPAMDTLMWEHPATVRHLRQLAEDHGGSVPAGLIEPLEACEAINASCPHLRIISPVSKRLACGDDGVGGMAAVSDIVRMVCTHLATE